MIMSKKGIEFLKKQRTIQSIGYYFWQNFEQQIDYLPFSYFFVDMLCKLLHYS